MGVRVYVHFADALDLASIFNASEEDLAVAKILIEGYEKVREISPDGKARDFNCAWESVNTVGSLTEVVYNSDLFKHNPSCNHYCIELGRFYQPRDLVEKYGDDNCGWIDSNYITDCKRVIRTQLDGFERLHEILNLEKLFACMLAVSWS